MMQVRAALTQTIIALAHHDYLSLEGGHHLVKFIVEQCSITDVGGAKVFFCFCFAVVFMHRFFCSPFAVSILA